MRLLHAALVVSLVVSVLGGVASADPAGDIQLDYFRPAMDSRGYLTINASQVLGDKELSFGLGALDWGHHLLSFGNTDGGSFLGSKCAGNSGPCYSIDNIVTATLIGAFGIHAGPAELEFGFSAPFVIMSGDRGPDDLGAPQDPNDDMQFKLSGQGVGNVGLHFKTRFIKTSRPPHVGLGVIASLYLPPPSSSQKNFMGWKGVTPQVIGILDKEFGRRSELRIALNGGIRIHSAETYTDNDPSGGATRTNEAITAGGEIPFGAGIAYAIAVQKFDVVGEVYGSVPLNGATNYQPLEAIAGVKLYLARNSFLSLGGGRGLIPDKGANPDLRAFIGIVFEPNIGDRDGDGLKDDIDKCPDDPEDFDGFEDEDGCPDPDNDRDGIPDVDDKCPNIPRTRTASRTRTAAPRATRTTATATASPTMSTSARTIRRTSTSSRTRTAAPIPTTTRTASSTSTICARTTPRTRTGSRTRTAAPIPTTTRTASSTRTTSARTSPRPTTGSRTRTAARIAVASS